MSGVATWTAVAALGGAGALARWRLTVAGQRWTSRFPAGTFAVNVTGSFAIGLLDGLEVTPHTMLLLATGLLGGYTTFSTWMIEAGNLQRQHALRAMRAYLAGALAAGLLAVAAGWLLGAALR
jgi:CrcB protein